MNSNYLIGSDPELFLTDSTGKIITAIGKIPGTKETPYQPSELAPGFGLQTDNILAEFNIPPIQKEQQLIDNMNTMKEYILLYLQKNGFNLKLACQASAIVDMDQLTDENSFVFGCDPDFSCYTNDKNPTPSLFNPFLRSAGCHWHLGYKDISVEKGLRLIKYMDMFLGVPSVIYDSDTDRRDLYGKAGSFRFQKHGVEYRTLSSYFISSNETISFCYKQIEKVVNAYESNIPLIPKEEVFETINNNNTDLANELIKKYKLL